METHGAPPTSGERHCHCTSLLCWQAHDQSLTTPLKPFVSACMASRDPCSSQINGDKFMLQPNRTMQADGDAGAPEPVLQMLSFASVAAPLPFLFTSLLVIHWMFKPGHGACITH
jgi:hypothetical protein